MSKDNKKKTFQNRQTDYLKNSVGAGINKDKFDGCISVICCKRSKLLRQEPSTIPLAGLRSFYNWQVNKCKLQIPCWIRNGSNGVYCKQLAWFLEKKQVYLSVVLPNKSKKYFQSLVTYHSN